jgi:uncharacterized tellurite resistance protein B-like protein
MATKKARTARPKRRTLPMDLPALRRHVDEVLAEVAGGDTSRFLPALGHLSAMVKDRESAQEARWHLLYFATAYIGAVQGGRDSDEDESAQVNALGPGDVAGLCEYIAEHPTYAELVKLVVAATPDRVDMIYGFLLTTIGHVFDADGELRREEQQFFEQLLRNPDIVARGLVADGELTAKFDAVSRAAVTKLGPLLLDEDKTMMVDTLVHACACDGDVDPREIETMVQALEMLGVTRQETFGILRELDARQTSRQRG